MSAPTEGDLALFDSAGEPTAYARRTDPETSHEAAQSIRSDKLRRSQEAVLALFRAQGAMTDVELVEFYAKRAEFGRVVPQSDSGIRTRRSELVTAGKVIDSGERVKLPSGRRAIVWKAAS